LPTDVALAVLGADSQTHKAPAYQISTQLCNAQLSYWWFS